MKNWMKFLFQVQELFAAMKDQSSSSSKVEKPDKYAPQRSLSSAATLTTIGADISPSSSHFFEVSYFLTTVQVLEARCSSFSNTTAFFVYTMIIRWNSHWIFELLIKKFFLLHHGLEKSLVYLNAFRNEGFLAKLWAMCKKCMLNVIFLEWVMYNSFKFVKSWHLSHLFRFIDSKIHFHSYLKIYWLKHSSLSRIYHSSIFNSTKRLRKKN